MIINTSYNTEGLKICSDCKIAKDIVNYHKNIKKYDGINNICKECIKIRSKKYYNKNIEQQHIKRRIKYLKNKDKDIKRDTEYKRLKCINDKSYKLLRSLRDRHSKAVKSAGKKKTFRTTDLLGCDSIYLKRYIEIQFKDNMSWSNYGIIWNLDHIYPLSRVDWNCIYETSKYCHYSNLQPMYIIDNIKKGNRINER